MRNAIGAGVPCATSKVCKYQGLYYRSFTRGFARKEGTGRARRFLRASRRRVLRDPRRTATLSLSSSSNFLVTMTSLSSWIRFKMELSLLRERPHTLGQRGESGALQTHSDLAMPNESPRGHRDPCTTP